MAFTRRTAIASGNLFAAWSNNRAFQNSTKKISADQKTDLLLHLRLVPFPSGLLFGWKNTRRCGTKDAYKEANLSNTKTEKATICPDLKTDSNLPTNSEVFFYFTNCNLNLNLNVVEVSKEQIFRLFHEGRRSIIEPYFIKKSKDFCVMSKVLLDSTPLL